MNARLDTSDSSHLRNVGIGKKILVIDDDKYARTISKKFIIDLSVLERIKLEEIQHLSEFTTSQTRRGIKVCFVLNSKHVKQSFFEFIETVNVSVVDSVEKAIKEIG